LKEIIDGLHLR